LWHVYPRPLAPRTAPPATGSPNESSLGGQAMIGSMNVYESSLKTFDPGSVYGVRILEGFSSEEGFPEDFGTTMFEGQAQLGVARVAEDGSWLAKVPANVPLHVQAVDVFGMSLENEPVWFSARAGESRVCGGCHENRAKTTIINPGITQAAAIGPLDAMGARPRAQRLMAPADYARTDLLANSGNTVAGVDKLVGMGWDTVVQPVFNANCLSCHDASNTAGMPSYSIVNAMTGDTLFTWTFNLSNTPVNVDYGMGMMDSYTASYFSIAGPDMEALEENGLMIVGNAKVSYMNPQDARNSDLIKLVNPTKLFPTIDTGVRAFPTTPHSAKGYDSGRELTPTEFYKLNRAVDMAGNFYARENNPKSDKYP